MNEKSKLCAGCGRTAKVATNIQLISGIEKVTYTNKNGVKQTIRKPKAEHSFDVCEDCFKPEKMRAERKHPWYALGGVALIVAGIILGIAEITGFSENSISLWKDIKAALEGLPYIIEYAALILATVVAIAISLVPILGGIWLLRHGFAPATEQATDALNDKFGKQIVAKLKETDKNGRFFACARTLFGEDYTLKVEDEPVELDVPCQLVLSREKKTIGSTTALRIFVNGEQQERLGNGKTIELETDLSKTLLAVVDKEDNAKTLEFDTPSGGTVHISLEYPGVINFTKYPADYKMH